MSPSTAVAAGGSQTMGNQTHIEASTTQATPQSDTPQALKTWWAGFKKRGKKDDAPKAAPTQTGPGIFGVPLAESIKYANVAISSIDDDGRSFTYGYVPIVVAKCGVYLKDKATDVEGIFRLSGSAKRIKELQTAFDSPDRYGKGLDWTGYTVHDAANVLRRYLNNLPQPIVPLEFYERFREPLRDVFNHTASDAATAAVAKADFNHDTAIMTYQKLITEIPPLNRQLLLYILDLLAVFASKSDVNLMTSANLAAIFQVGVLSHPTHDMNPEAYRLSQDVLIFLIDNQDSFHIGMSGTAADEKTVKEFSGGSVPQQPDTPSKAALGRSTSNGSTPGEGRRISGLRRNVSTSSKNSRQSSQGPSTPLSGQFGNSSVHRSNTLPTKKSPVLPSPRFNRGLDSPNTPVALSPALIGQTDRTTFTNTGEPSEKSDAKAVDPSAVTVEGLGLSQSVPNSTSIITSDADKNDSGPKDSAAKTNQSPLPPVKNRKVTDVILNLTGGPDKDGRQPNKLKKKRIPSTVNASGNSSTASLVGTEPLPGGLSAARSPTSTPEIHDLNKVNDEAPLTVNPADITPTGNESDPATPVPRYVSTFQPNQIEEAGKLKAPSNSDGTQYESGGLRPRAASQNSTHSKSSVTDLSEVDHDQTTEERAQQKEKRRLWRFSQSAKKSKSPARVGTNVGAEQSSSSISSWHRSRKSVSNDTNPSNSETVPSVPASNSILGAIGHKHRSRSRGKSREESGDGTVEEEKEEKQGFFGKLKKKVNQARAKSPQSENERTDRKNSLSAIANEPTSPRRPSVVQQTIPEQVETEPVIAEKPAAGQIEQAESKKEIPDLESHPIPAEGSLSTSPPTAEVGNKTAEPAPATSEHVASVEAEKTEPQAQEAVEHAASSTETETKTFTETTASPVIEPLPLTESQPEISQPTTVDSDKTA